MLNEIDRYIIMYRVIEHGHTVNTATLTIITNKGEPKHLRIRAKVAQLHHVHTTCIVIAKVIHDETVV